MRSQQQTPDKEPAIIISLFEDCVWLASPGRSRLLIQFSQTVKQAMAPTVYLRLHTTPPRNTSLICPDRSFLIKISVAPLYWAYQGVFICILILQNSMGLQTRDEMKPTAAPDKAIWLIGMSYFPSLLTYFLKACLKVSLKPNSRPTVRPFPMNMVEAPLQYPAIFIPYSFQRFPRIFVNGTFVSDIWI